MSVVALVVLAAALLGVGAGTRAAASHLLAGAAGPVEVQPAAGAVDLEVPDAARPRVVLRPGDTLWQVASRVAPGEDRGRVVALLRDLNGLGTRPPQAGQQLLLPLPAELAAG